MKYNIISLFDLAKLVNKAVQYEHKDIPDSLSMLHHLTLDDGKTVIAVTVGNSVILVENHCTSKSSSSPHSEIEPIAA